MGFGMPELMIVLFIVTPWLVAIVIVAWALRALYKMQQAQSAMAASLQRIEELLARR